MTNTWPTKKIKEFCEFKYGKNLPADKRVDGPYPVYGSSSIASYHENYLIEAPGLIIGRKGTVGKVQLSKENYFPIDTTFYVDKTCTEENIFFLYYFFQLCGFEDMNSDAAVPGLNRNAAINLKVSLPPREVQNKIATVLLAYDDLIENNLKRIKLLEEMAQITYEEWFVRMKFPGHETAVFDEETGLPEGWGNSKIEELAEVTSSKRVFLSDYVEEGVNFYRGKEVILKSKNEDITDPLYISYSKFEELKKKFGVPEDGDILVTAVGTLGYPYQVSDTDEDFYFKDGNLIWLRNIASRSMSNYLISLFQSDGFKSSLNNIAIGSSQKALTIKAVKGIKLLRPTNVIVEEFDKIIEPTFSSRRNLLQQIKWLKEARDILLPRLMTGMINIEQVELPEAMLNRLEQQEDKMATAV